MALTDRPTLAAAAGAACIASSATLVRLADVEPATAATFRCLYALPILGFLLLREDRRYGTRPGRDRWLAAAAGVFFGLDLVLWHHAIAAVGAGIATVLGNLQVVVVGFLAWWLLGERPSRRLVLAVPVVMVGVVLISGVVGAGAYGDDPTMGVVFGLGTSLAYAAFLLLLRHGSKDLRRAAGPLFDATAVARRRVHRARSGVRRHRPGAELAGPRLAGRARADVAGRRLAADRRCRCRGCRRP